MMTMTETGLMMLGGLATVVSTYVGLAVRPLEREQGALDKRIDGLHDEAKEERSKTERYMAHVEQRVASIEQSYVSRADLERTINSVGERMDRGLLRVEAGMKELGSKVDSLAERVTRVEAS